MKKTNVDLLREISRNKSKFISILIIMFLGVFVFAGLRETPPTMRNTANTYFKEVNIYDLHVTNERGISPELLKVVEGNKNVADYETYYQKEAKVDGYSNKIQLISLPTDIAKAKVVEGKLPETSDEMVLAESLRDKFSLGQTVKFSYKDKDNKEISKDYKVVGYVYGAHAPDATSSNKASLNFFAYVTEDNVKSDRFTGLNISLANIDKSDYSNSNYYQEVNKVRDELITAFDKESDKESKDFKEKSTKTWQENNRKLSVAKKQLEDSEKSVEQLKNISPDRYESAKKELDTNKAKIQEQDEALKISKKQIDDYKYPKYKVDNIKDNASYKQFIDSMDSLLSIANIFSVFLFAVSILVTLATISRMVEENRINIGTLKSLGFGSWAIAKKYYLYASLSAISGGILGLVASYFIIVPLVYDSYAKFLIFKKALISVSPSTIILSLAIVIACVLVAVYLPISKILSERAAYLLRPKAPKAASRILLEYIPFIWSRLSFLRKVTFRNIFRYKVRMAMTIFGVMGSLALMFIGFGIKYGVQDISNIQFNKINNYKLTASYNPYIAKSEVVKLDEYIDGKSSDYKKINLSRATIEKDNTVLDQVNIYSLDTELTGYLDLYKGSGSINLTDDGVIINEKLAYLHNLQVGDTFGIVWNQERYELKVADINRNYFGHNVYMTDDYYKKVFNKEYEYNTYLIKADGNNSAISEIEKELLTNEKIVNVQNTSKYEDILKNVVEGIDLIVLVIVCCSTSLALVVLYNLININVSERIRELSTIKVLGFYPREVTSYVFREVLYLSIIGIALGNYVGYLLYKKIILDLASRSMMFESNPLIWVYVLSSAITVLILIVLMIIVHRRLKSINMVEALKGVE